MKNSYFKVGEDDDGYSVKVNCILLGLFLVLSTSVLADSNALFFGVFKKEQRRFPAICV